MTTTSNWSRFGSISKLDIAINGIALNEMATVYANSKNLLEIIVTIEILDNNDDVIPFTEDELKGQIYFCNYTTGGLIGSPWKIESSPNDYTNTVTDRSKNLPSTNSTSYVYKYIGCSELSTSEITQRISVGIDVPGIGPFDTSENGTTTPNCAPGQSGSALRTPHSVEVKAILPINYSQHENISMECGTFEEVDNGQLWESKYTFLDGTFFKKHYDGKCKRRFVYIKPNKNTTGQEKFRFYNIEFDKIDNNDIWTGTIGFQYKVELCFSILEYNSDPPFAVIGSGGSEYHVNLWFPRRSSIRMNGGVFMEDNSYYYRFNATGEKDHRPEDDPGVASLILYKFVLPENNCRQYKWIDVVRKVTVSFTDNYGNY